MATTGPKYAGTAADTGTDAIGGSAEVWANPSNATGPDDGSYSTNSWPTGGDASNGLKLTNFGFAIPSTAVIDGIFVEFKRQGSAAATYQINLVKAGSIVSASTKAGTDFWPSVSSPAYTSYGGISDLWGTPLTPADVNASNFGVVLYAYNTHGGGEGYVDAVRITVTWHAGPHEIPRQKYYIYKVYDSQTGEYLGNIPNVSSDFAFSQDINTSGVQMTVKASISADVVNTTTSALTDESGGTITDESTNTITDEPQTPLTGIGTSQALIRDGNKVKIFEIGYYAPNAICVFNGVIDRHEDNFGGDTGDNDVTMLLYSDGYDMVNHLVRGSPFAYTTDQSQTSDNASDTLFMWDKGGAYVAYGQTWKVGSGVTNLGAITLLMAGSAQVTIQVWTDTSMTTLLGTITQNVSVGGATAVQFAFPAHIPVTAGTTYFFTVSVAAGNSITIYYQNSNVYSNGTAYSINYSGTSGSWAAITADLYFITSSSNGSTVATFSGVDPSSGMVVDFMEDYNAEGGKITIGNVEATGLTLSYGFNTNTVVDGLQGALSVSPNGFYYYVDLGLDELFFQQASETADITLTKGVHISKLTIVSTTEYVVNACYVIGGPDPSNPGFNIYTLDVDIDSISRYGLRLQVHSDSNIPDTTTAHAVGSSIVAANKDEQYQTQVTIVDRTMDLNTLNLGKIIGFNGFGNYIDDLLAQNVHVDRASLTATLTLGILPKRTTTSVEQITRNLIALSTLTNPTSPS